MLHHQNDKYKNIQGKQKYKCHEKLICSNGELVEKNSLFIANNVCFYLFLRFQNCLVFIIIFMVKIYNVRGWGKAVVVNYEVVSEV